MSQTAINLTRRRFKTPRGCGSRHYLCRAFSHRADTHSAFHSDRSNRHRSIARWTSEYDFSCLELVPVCGYRLSMVHGRGARPSRGTGRPVIFDNLLWQRLTVPWTHFRCCWGRRRPPRECYHVSGSHEKQFSHLRPSFDLPYHERLCPAHVGCLYDIPGNDLATDGYDAALAGIPYLSTRTGHASELQLTYLFLTHLSCMGVCDEHVHPD
jgi:hypothetical protein